MGEVPTEEWTLPMFEEAYKRLWRRAMGIDRSTESLCPQCGSLSMRTMGVQLRRADEGEGTLEICSSCQYKKLF